MFGNGSKGRPVLYFRFQYDVTLVERLNPNEPEHIEVKWFDTRLTDHNLQWPCSQYDRAAKIDLHTRENGPSHHELPLGYRLDSARQL